MRLIIAIAEGSHASIDSLIMLFKVIRDTLRYRSKIKKREARMIAGFIKVKIVIREDGVF